MTQIIDAQAVVMNVGINDAIRGVSDSGFRSCYSQLRQLATAAGKIFVFETPNYNDNSYASNVEWKYWDEATEYNLVSNIVPIIDQYDFTAKLGSPWDTCLSDGIHPTNYGYIMKASLEFQVLSSFVQEWLSTH